MKGKRTKKTNIIKAVVISILSIIFLICIAYIIVHFYTSNKEKEIIVDVQKANC